MSGVYHWQFVLKCHCGAKGPQLGAGDPHLVQDYARIGFRFKLVCVCLCLCMCDNTESALWFGLELWQKKSVGHTHILSYTCILIKSLSVCLSSPLFGGEEGPTQSGVRGPYTGPDFSVKRLAWIEWLIICQCIPWIKYIRYENASIKKIVQVVYFKIFLIKKCSKRVGYPGCQGNIIKNLSI